MCLKSVIRCVRELDERDARLQNNSHSFIYLDFCMPYKSPLALHVVRVKHAYSVRLSALTIEFIQFIRPIHCSPTAGGGGNDLISHLHVFLRKYALCPVCRERMRLRSVHGHHAVFARMIEDVYKSDQRRKASLFSMIARR